MKKLSSALKLSTRQITVIGMMSAISIVMGLTGFGFIPFPTVKATIMHLPVIASSILEGPLVGAFVGLIFGLFSLYQNMTNPSALSFAFYNPLVSILPRILIGITSYYAYKYMFSKSETVKITVATIVGSLTNTLGVLTMIFVLYAKDYAKIKNIDVSAVAMTIYGAIALPYGTVEALVSVAIIVPLVLAVKKLRRR